MKGKTTTSSRQKTVKATEKDESKRKVSQSAKTSSSKSNKTNSKRSAVKAVVDENRKNVMEKIQEMVQENEEAVHLILEITALTIQKSNLSLKTKRISKAALALLLEILSEDNNSNFQKEFALLKNQN